MNYSGRFALLLIAAFAGDSAFSQDAAVNVDPRPLGIDLAPGPVAPGKDQTVTTAGLEGEPPAVGRVHVRVGDGARSYCPMASLSRAKPANSRRPIVRLRPSRRSSLAKLLAAEFPGFKIKATNHYLYVYTTSEEFQLATSRILESMFAGLKTFAGAQKVPTHDPAVPLVVVMFKTDEEFQKYRRMPDGIVAYYHILCNRVFMYEQSRLAEVRPDLAIQQSISTIAHEGAHQILHNIGVQQRLSFWPMWLGEGLAEYLAPTSTGARLKWKGPGEVNDLRMFELEQYLKSDAANEPDGELIDHTVLAGRLTCTGYASAWALTHYLAKNRRAEFGELLRECSQLGPLEGAIEIAPPGIVRSNHAAVRQASSATT